MFYIREQLNATFDLTGRNAIRLAWGVWNFDKSYIMTQVCGSTPAPATWICQ